uniref:Lipocalin n=1 Tax=Rhipicephalus appendiculatus TaxID=34631 RepID=A0A131YHS8_RHIAP
MQFYLIVTLAMVQGSYGSEKVTEEVFMRTLKTETSFWMVQRSYNDLVDKKEKVCINTKEGETARAGDARSAASHIFFRSYKLFGCDWFPFTHDAEYEVTFSNDPTAGAGLSMTMELIKKGQKNISTYEFQYWDRAEKCFVLTETRNGQKLCELHAWDSAAKPQAQFSTCDEEYKKHCKETTMSHQVFTDNCRVNASTWTPNRSQDISGCFQQTT